MSATSKKVISVSESDKPLREAFNMNLRISRELRRQLLEWTISNEMPYSTLVRGLIVDYFAGKRMR